MKYWRQPSDAGNYRENEQIFSSNSLWIIYVEFISLMIGYITFSQWVAVYLSHLKQKNMKVRAVRNIANCKKCFHKNRLSWIGLKCIDSFKNSLSLRKPNLWVLGFHPWKEPWSIVWENQGSWKVKLDCITLLVPKNAPPTPPSHQDPWISHSLCVRVIFKKYFSPGLVFWST